MTRFSSRQKKRFVARRGSNADLGVSEKEKTERQKAASRRRRAGTKTMEKEKTQYSQKSFWKKVKKFSGRIGEVPLTLALQLYYAAEKKETPKWAKATIVSALAYFILPLDAIPDIAPLVGFTDDYCVLVAAVSTLASNIDDEVKQKAQKKVEDIFRRTSGSQSAHPKTKRLLYP